MRPLTWYDQCWALPGLGISRRWGGGIPALQAAVSSQSEGSAATWHNGNDASLVRPELLLSTIFVDSDSAVCQAHPNIGANRGHRRNASACLLYNTTFLGQQSISITALALLC